MKIGRVLVAAATGVVLMLGLAAAPAYAACTGNGCDGKDAVTQGCSADAYTATSASIASAAARITIELRRSDRCRAVWARFTAESGTGGFISGYRFTVREYDAHKDFIRQYATDVEGIDVYRARTKMMAVDLTKYFRACWRYIFDGQLDSELHCTAFV